MALLTANNITQLLTIAVGSPQTWEAPHFSIPYPLTIRAKPGTNGTILVEYRITPTGDFIAWPAGTVNAATVMKLNGPVEALRLTAAVADGICEIAQ